MSLFCLFYIIHFIQIRIFNSTLPSSVRNPVKKCTEIVSQKFTFDKDKIHNFEINTEGFLFPRPIIRKNFFFNQNSRNGLILYSKSISSPYTYINIPKLNNPLPSSLFSSGLAWSVLYISGRLIACCLIPQREVL